MTKVMINFRCEEWIHECLSYSRQLSPIFFDEGGITVTLLFTISRHISDDSKDADSEITKNPVQQKNNHNLTYETPADEIKVFEHPLCSEPPTQDEIESKYLPENMAICIIPDSACELHMNAHLACCVSAELKRSRKFRRRFLKYLGRKYGFSSLDNYYEKMDFSQLQQCEFMNIIYMVDITTVWAKQKIDYPWNYRLQCLVAKRQILEEVMSWLSTLGGAYSALGDYFKSHAEAAGELSKQQLQIAIELGDPIVAAKCRIFWALSLLQRGHLRECRIIVRSQYRFATTCVVSDQRLINMCLAVWQRLQYTYKIRKTHKKLKAK